MTDRRTLCVAPEIGLPWTLSAITIIIQWKNMLWADGKTSKPEHLQLTCQVQKNKQMTKRNQFILKQRITN